MAIKAAFFDIDGTLVSFKTHQIPASTISAIEQAKEQGVKIFISTGRPVALINNIGSIRHLIDGYITFNGARTFIDEKDITLMPIPKKEVMAMIEDATLRDYAVLLCGRDRVALHNHKPIFDEIFVQGLGVNNVDTQQSITPLLDQPILQLTPFFKKEDEAKIILSMPHCVSARWHPEFTDITIKGADKGNAMKQLTKHLNINLNECVAFGDGGNDRTILQTAGIGIAMGNANEDIKATADYITTSVDEDGIRNAFIHLGIINK